MIDSGVLKQIIKYEKKITTNHTFIIKKEHFKMDSDKFCLPQVPGKLSQRNSSRSKSEKKQQSKEKSQISFRNPNFLIEAAHLKKERVRIRGIHTEKNSPSKMFDSSEHKSKSLSTQRELVNIKQNTDINLKTYLQFIRSSQSSEYLIKVNFDSLRKGGRKMRLENSDKDLIQMYASIFNTLYEGIANYTPQWSEKIQANCLKYLQCQQKAKIQILLSMFYPKLLHSKLRPYLVYQRQLIYLLYLLSKENILDKIGRVQQQSIKFLIKYTKECLDILVEPLLQLEQRVLSQINSTFIILKAIGQMEKRLLMIQKEMGRIIVKSNQQLLEVLNSLNELIVLTAEWPLETLTKKEMELSWKYAKLPPVPYLPPKASEKKAFTLVLEFQNVLVYYDQQNKVLKYRPFVDIFLSKLKEVFQIVIYTRTSHQFTEVIVNQIEKVGKYFDYCLCENHLKVQNSKKVKNYSQLGRNKRKLIIIDYTKPQSPEYLINFIQISQWFGNKDDRQLSRLTNVLWELHISKVEDAPAYLRELQMKDENIYGD